MLALWAALMSRRVGRECGSVMTPVAPLREGWHGEGMRLVARSTHSHHPRSVTRPKAAHSMHLWASQVVPSSWSRLTHEDSQTCGGQAGAVVMTPMVSESVSEEV